MKALLFVFLFINLYSKEIIGSIDKLDFPLLNIENVATRVDTGATNSSIHCTNIEKINDKFVRCNILGKESLIKEISKIKEVKSSNGVSQNRYFIKTEIVILGKTYVSELSLNDRSSMTYPFLLGRDILIQDFIVDVSKENLSLDFKERTKN